MTADCRDELDDARPRRGELEAATAAPFPRLSYSEAVDLLTGDATQIMLDAEQEGLEDEKHALEEERDRNRAAYGQAKKGEKRRIDAREIEINVRLDEIEEGLRNVPTVEGQRHAPSSGAPTSAAPTRPSSRATSRRPVIVHRYPAAVKAFYMKRDPEDDRLALGMDVLAPEGYGEIIGGGERATDLDFLTRPGRGARTARVGFRLVLRPPALRDRPARRLRPRAGADGRLGLRAPARPRDGPLPAAARPAPPVAR